jgi:hypothetical protein
VETKRATPREESGKGESGQSVKKIFIGGLKDGIEDKDLEDYFGAFGRVINVEQVNYYFKSSISVSIISYHASTCVVF